MIRFIFSVSLILGVGFSIDHTDLLEKAPDWTLQSTEGETISLNDLTGDIVLIDFWAIWNF